jgi:signal transduction histidine kinase
MRVRGIGWTLVGLATVCAIAQAWLLRTRNVVLLSAAAVDDAFPVVPVAIVICTGMGAVVVSRYPRHRIGWLLLLQVGAGVGLVAGQVAQLAYLPSTPIPRSVAGWAILTSKGLGVPWALGCLALVFLLVPDGHPPSKRWRVVLWQIVVAYGLTVASLVLIGPDRAAATVAGAVPRWLRTSYEVGQVAVALTLLPALAALLLRTRRATGLQRRQLLWVLAGAGALVFGTASYLGYGSLPGSTGGSRVWVELLFHAGYMAVPLCAGVAVWKYHLYDVDLVVRRGVRLAAVTLLVTAGYGAVVTVIDTTAAALLPPQWRGVGTPVTAFVVVVLALQPLQRRLRALADRVVYGPRAAAYSALAGVIRGMPGDRGPRDLLQRVAGAAAATCDGAATARLLLPTGHDLSVTVSTRARSPVPPSAASAPGSSYAWPVVHGGQYVGGLEVEPHDTRLSQAQRELFSTFAGHAGLAFRNAWLQTELAARAEALAADTAALADSRRRLVQVAYAERDRLSATIQRDVLVHIRGLEDEVRRIRQLLPTHSDQAAVALDRARAEVNTALDELRSLTRGVYPAVLSRRGLIAAISSAMSNAPLTTQLRAYGPMDQLPEQMATTAYFVTVESLRDLADPREAVLGVEDGKLQIEVIGRSRPEASSQGVRDRVEACGGTIEPQEQDGRRRLLISLPLPEPTATLRVEELAVW